MAEALRSGAFSVGKGQVEASLSLGLSYPATLRRIVIPQAFRSVIPTIGSLVIAMIRNSAIVGVSLLALPDLLKEARIVQSRTFETGEVFFWAGVGYLILTVATTLVVPLSRAALRGAAMTYLFDPANWQWLVTGNDVRFILEGFLVNLEIAAIAMVVSLVFGLLLALAAGLQGRGAERAAGLWIDLWRNLPLIFMILFFALAMPQPWREAYESIIPGVLPGGAPVGRVLAALTALILYNSAVLAEIMRPGSSRSSAASATPPRRWALTNLQSMRLVILPQGLRRMVPATVSQLITLNKDTTLVSIIAIQEVMRHGRIVTSSNFFGGVEAPVLQVFIFIGLLFIVVNLAALTAVAAARDARARRTGTTLKRVSGLEDQVAAESDVRPGY